MFYISKKQETRAIRRNGEINDLSNSEAHSAAKDTLLEIKESAN